MAKGTNGGRLRCARRHSALSAGTSDVSAASRVAYRRFGVAATMLT